MFQNRLLSWFTVLALTVLCNAADNCRAQNWQDPALQQPVPQYYSPGRYPLGGVSETPTAIDKTLDLFAVPESNSLPAVKAKPVKVLPSTPPAPQTGVPKTQLVAPKKDTATKKIAANAKAAAKKKVDAKTKAAVKKKAAVPERHATLDWDVYRDRSKYPIDPRKPCSSCKRALGQCECGIRHGQSRLGNQGRPWQDAEPGGRACRKQCRNNQCPECTSKRPEFSVYWPKPFSAKRANREDRCVGCGHERCRCRKVNDLFDHLANFSLIDYQRTDNGYCGPGADPYGCLGEQRSRVAGIGYRFPSEPVQR